MKLRLALPVAAAAALVAASSAAAFTPSNAFYGKQWYLGQDHAFDAWTTPPELDAVKVAIVDSGVDCSLPDFQGQIAAKKSFVGGNPCTDSQGHGTIVAGEIAGGLNQAGVVGLAYKAQLLVAKVVAPDGTIPLKAEAAAIRWATDQGARVINLSFGAVRDPLDPALDTYSAAEAQAVAYAVKKGVVVVAAVGNADEAYATPWGYASWPAALPHVLGVGALTRSGNVPDFSDQDPTFVDIAAPGVGIFSTFPTALTSQQKGCTLQGYTDCASGDYHRPEGTSFAAPQVSAAAALLLGLDPSLKSNQVTTILERSADDVYPASGCPGCPAGRDKFSGWGSLDVQKAVAALNSGAPLPPADRLEPNDKLSQAPALGGSAPVVKATVDYWDDPKDFYRVKLERGQRLEALVRSRRATVALSVWGDSTRRPATVAKAGGSGKKERVAFRARRAGWYSVLVRATQGSGRYTLHLSKSR
ncbi:MAG TPA: S8 family serine peptidase [Gaiellaceae bacterium]|nr:S8 family serine peptidase [Gaiellaceae bacterium]